MSVANSSKSTTKHFRITQKSRNYLVFLKPGGRDFEAPYAAGQRPGRPAKVPQPPRFRAAIVSAIGLNRGDDYVIVSALIWGNALANSREVDT
jgi:hypothetical protein